MRTAFVTGAARGIGLAIATALARNGNRVVLADLDEEGLHQAADSLGQAEGSVFPVRCDVTDAGELRSRLAETHRRFGRLEILVNNAGVQYIAPLEEFPDEQFHHLLRVMLVGPFLAIKEVFPWMKEQGWGRIINVASINGLVGFPGKAAYNSAKHGLIGLTRVAALEGAGFGITVNALCPGYVDTPLVRNQLQDLARIRGLSVERVLEEVIYPLVPQRRLLSAEEVAQYALFLAAEEAAGITGQAVVIDGGYTAQ